MYRCSVVVLAVLALWQGPVVFAEPAESAAPPAATQPVAESPHTWLLHLPGIGGEMPIDHGLIKGLKQGEWQGETTIYDWTEHDPGLDALRNRHRNLREAQKVADMIRDRFRKDPALKITLTSHSGGTGIAVWALERLPDNVEVQDLVLLASALSPGYDLSKALKHVRGKAYCYYSAGDALVLGTGTRMFGTIDGVRTEAAGLIGFRTPRDADPAQYAKLVQVPYDKGWMVYGHIGNHIGCMSPLFAKNVLAPALIADMSDTAATRPAADPGTASGR